MPDDILKDILAAEKKAREATDKAEKYRADTISAVEAEKQKIIDDRMRDAEKEVERLRSEHMKSVEQSLESVTKKYADAHERTRKAKEENVEIWAREIVDRVLGGDEQ